MPEAPFYTAAGERRDAVALPAEFFDGRVSEPALHRAVTAYLNNQRQGTAATKTRSYVSGGNQKPWKQKGTGRARQGSTRAPHWRGGAVIFGPSPRSYTTALPRKLKQLARRSAFNARVAEGRFHVVEGVALAAPKTKDLLALLARLGVAGQRTLLLTHGLNRAVYLSARNVPHLEVMPFAEASAYDVLWAEQVVAEHGALTGAGPAEVEAGAPAPATRTAKKAAAKAPAARKPKGEG